MSRVDFVSFDRARPGWNYSFQNPRGTRWARRPSEVEGVLGWAESESKRGRWVALALAYEAAATLNPELPAGRLGPEPLAWAASFSKPVPAVRPRPKPFSHTPWRPGVDADAHRRSISRIKTLIARGDTYQVNHTFPLECRFSGDARSWFWSLGPAQGARYAAFIDGGRWKWLSLSPELFFELRGNRVVLRPMKGSAPRGRWPAEDAELGARLGRSPKDRAENLMIVDLLRNDLGKVARPGTIHARSLFRVEKYPTVHQLTSTVAGRLGPGVAWRQCLAALFPSGSVTGAPKRRTMEIIRRLETAPRGLYTGAIGLIRPDGSGGIQRGHSDDRPEWENGPGPLRGRRRGDLGLLRRRGMAGIPSQRGVPSRSGVPTDRIPSSGRGALPVEGISLAAAAGLREAFRVCGGSKVF
ncbi:MAG: chorismate-binding protein [Elusimicrobia bacterium]|nr:chorismate-binding protein [Elusimicrobiota bacterium]